MTTGGRIKAARKAAGMTQEELGKKLGVSGSSIAQYENNLRNPKIETLNRIASALDVSVDTLKKSPSEAGEGRAIDVNELRSLSKGGPLTIIAYGADGERIEKKFDNWQAVYDELDEEGKRQFVRIMNKELDAFYSKYSKLKPDSQKRLFVYLNDLVGNPENLRIKPSTPPDKEGENNE